MELCPKCKKEILPYLRTGEFKQIELGRLKTYQLYFCINCKIVYSQEHEKFEFLNLEEERAKINRPRVNASVGRETKGKNK